MHLMDFNQMHIITLIGVICIGAFIKFFREASKSRNWIKSTGRIIEINIINEEYGSNDYGYIKKIRYEYSYNKKVYSSNQINKGLNFHHFDKYAASQQFPRYKKGMMVNVFINPNDPSDAVLENDMPVNIFGVLAIGVVLILIGIFG